MAGHRLSKTRIMSGRQCPKRLYLHVHHPELEVVSEDLAQRFEIGHAVGELARRLLPGGVLIGHVDDLPRALAQTRALLDQRAMPVFEAAFTHEGILIRADLLEDGRGGIRLTEVKASTEVKDYQLLDCAIQAWVVAGAGYPVERIAVAHVDSGFVYEREGDYSGLLNHQDVTEQVRPLQAQVRQWVDESRAVLAGPMPELDIGDHCRQPFECPFFDYCNPIRTDYPLTTLPRGGRVAAALIAEGIIDIRDIPDGRLRNHNHERIRRAVVAGEPSIDPEIGKIVRALPYPRYYLDFETIGFAVPRWLGTSPYRQLPFQWSCHIEDSPGSLRHEEFLDISGEAPMRGFVESLLDALGDHGPIIVYSGFEETLLKEMARMFPEYESRIHAAIDRLVDLLPLARKYYYHPAMHGSWSIKRVLPTIAPDLDYGRLEGVHHGGEAQTAYLECIAPETDAQRRAILERQMRAYCRQDTLAMVEIARFFGD